MFKKGNTVYDIILGPTICRDTNGQLVDYTIPGLILKYILVTFTMSLTPPIKY